HEPIDLFQFLRSRNDVKLVAWAQNFSSVRNDDLLTSKNQSYQRVLRRAGFVEIFDRLTCRPAAGVNVHSEQLDAALGEINDVRDAWNSHHAEDPVRDFTLRVDDQVDMQARFLTNPSPVIHFMSPEPCDLNLHLGIYLSNQTDEYVDVVYTRQRDQHFSVPQTGLLEGAHAGCAAPNDSGIEDLLQLQAALRVLLNNHDFVSFSNQPGSYQSGYLPPTCNQDAHKLEEF